MDLGWNELPFPYLVLDEAGRVLAGNARAAEELGRSAESMAQLNALDLLGPESAEGRFRLPGKSQPVRCQSRPITLGRLHATVLTWASCEVAISGGAAATPETGVPLATILVAEDEDSIRDICRRVLVDAGYQVLVAANGQAAIELLADMGESVDLVLADVVMPVAGGEAIFEYLRRAELKVPIVFTSGYALRNSPSEMLESPGITLLRKPYTLAQLLATVKAALA